MNKIRRICIFDLQLMKYTYTSFAYPSTAGLVLSGYHLGRRDSVILTDKPPTFNMYDTVYIIKDDIDLYYESEWVKFNNVVLVGRYWSKGLAVWYDEWLTYPPSMMLYKRWYKAWSKNIKLIDSRKTDMFNFKPVWIKKQKQLIEPKGDKILIIDYDPHLISPNHSFLKSLTNKEITILQWFDLTHDIKSTIELLNCPNFNTAVPIPLIVNEQLTPVKMQTIAQYWFENKKIFNNWKIKRFFQGTSNTSWKREIIKTIKVINIWREYGGISIESIPIDPMSFECPDLLNHLRMWSFSRQENQYFSLIDSILVHRIPNTEQLINLLKDPYAVWWDECRRGTNPKYIVSYCIFTYLEKEPVLLRELLTFVPIRGKRKERVESVFDDIENDGID